MSLKTCVLAAVMCCAASAEDACDETSFVQVKQVVKNGGERIPNEAADWSTPVHDSNAITDSTPDHLDDGQVTDAFADNAEKVRDEIEGKAADRIDFTNSEREERKASYAHAAHKVAALKESTKEAQEQDAQEVAHTRKVREQVKKAAAERVKEAKEDAEAHHIKAAQAESAAVLGRRIGTIEGRDVAAHEWGDYRKKVAAQNREAAREAARAQIAKRRHAYEDAVNANTEAIAAAEEAETNDVDKWATAARAKSAAEAAVAEENIEGAEGMKNRIADVMSDFAVHEYARSTAESQEDVEEAAEGQWPEGNWPDGP